MCCDYRIMVGNERFRIGLNETQIGLVAPPWYGAAACACCALRQTFYTALLPPFYVSCWSLCAVIVKRLTVRQVCGHDDQLRGL